MLEMNQIKVLTQEEQIRYCRKNDTSEKGTALNGEIDRIALLVVELLQTLPVEAITPTFITSLRQLVTYSTVLGLRETPLKHVVKTVENGFGKFNAVMHRDGLKKSSLLTSATAPQHPQAQ